MTVFLQHHLHRRCDYFGNAVRIWKFKIPFNKTEINLFWTHVKTLLIQFH